MRVLTFLLIIICTNISGQDWTWLKMYPEAGSDLRPRCIQALPSGGVVIAGTTNRDNWTWNEIFLKAIDTAGTVIWADSLVGDSSSKVNYGGRLTVGPGGEIYVAGCFTGTLSSQGQSISSDSSTMDNVFLARYSSSGILLYLRKLVPAGYVYGMDANSDGGVTMLCGFYNGMAILGEPLIPAYRSTVIIRLSATGSVVWYRQLYGDCWTDKMIRGADSLCYIMGGYGDSIVIDGHQYMGTHSGAYGYDYYRLALDQDGHIVAKNILTPGAYTDCDVLSHGDGFVVAALESWHGCSTIVFAHDTSWTTAWSFMMPAAGFGYGEDYAYDHLARGRADNFYAFGESRKVINYGAGDYDMNYVLSEIDYNGNLISTDSFAQPNDLYWPAEAGIASDQQSIYITGVMVDSLTIHQLHADRPGQTMFLARKRLGTVATGIPAISRKSELSLYPDPMRDHFSISGLPSGSYNIQILNSAGQLVYNRSLSTTADHIWISAGLPAGVYAVRVSGEGELRVLRFVSAGAEN